LVSVELVPENEINVQSVPLFRRAILRQPEPRTAAKQRSTFAPV
jgi:hypothetical protein